jgi:hypothetical protein
MLEQPIRHFPTRAALGVGVVVPDLLLLLPEPSARAR